LKKNKAIALISGGLDSILAARMVMEQGIEVEGVCFIMPFLSKDTGNFKKRVKAVSDKADVKVDFIDISEDFLVTLKKPRYGYGSNINPCIDCKILMLNKAKAIMSERGASFVVTGEVLNERPMSQTRQSLEIIKKRSGLEDFLLRPLSAKFFEETEPEKNGMLKKADLGDIHGRSRKKQFELAARYGIDKYFVPGGGCLLTDPRFSKRIIDLIANNDLTADEIDLIKFGRHFRLDKETKAVVGRDDPENMGLMALKKDTDLMMRLVEKASPYVLLRGKTDEVNIKRAAELCVSHSKSKNLASEKVEYWYKEEEKREIAVSAVPESEIDPMRI
jgi:tRNA U34 2-thiouridine synthase MnmA/TrmU